MNRDIFPVLLRFQIIYTSTRSGINGDIESLTTFYGPHNEMNQNRLEVQRCRFSDFLKAEEEWKVLTLPDRRNSRLRIKKTKAAKADTQNSFLFFLHYEALQPKQGVYQSITLV